jgi:hypothetical protein
MDTFLIVRLNIFQEEAWQKHYLENGPVAMTLHSNVSISVGGTIQLPCRIKNLGEYTVSYLLFFYLKKLEIVSVLP